MCVGEDGLVIATTVGGIFGEGGHEGTDKPIRCSLPVHAAKCISVCPQEMGKNWKQKNSKIMTRRKNTSAVGIRPVLG